MRDRLKAVAERVRKVSSRTADYYGISRLREYLRMRHRRNAVFVWIPKTAGASFFSCMDTPKLWASLHRVRYRFASRGTVTFSHMDYAGFVREGYVSMRFDESAYKFSFVRNPYDRTVSLFYYLRKQGSCRRKKPSFPFAESWVIKAANPSGCTT